MRVAVVVIFDTKQGSFLLKQFDDLRVRGKDIFARKKFHIRCKPAGVIDGAINFKSVKLAYMKIVRAVARCCVNTAGAGFASRFVFIPRIEFNLGISFAKSDVLAVHYQGNAVEPCMLSFEPVEL